MAFASAPELLALHGARIKGFTKSGAVARRFGVDADLVEELLQDFEAMGWVQRSGFADVTGWSLTGAGRVENVRQLAAELTAYDLRDSVASAHEFFTEENGYFLDAITKWQVRPQSWDPMAANDHTDWRWDERVLSSLAVLSRALRPIKEELAGSLTRFEGYADRFAASLARAEEGQKRWWMNLASIRATPCGSNSMKTCSRLLASNEVSDSDRRGVCGGQLGIYLRRWNLTSPPGSSVWA